MTNKIILLLFLIIQMANLHAQDNQVIQTCVDKTTMLVFDSKIIHVDLGVNSGIAYQLDDNIPNILKLKIASSFRLTDMTNLLVICQNDLVFSFDVIYRTDIAKYVYLIPDSLAVNKKLKSLKITTDLSGKQIHDKVMSDTYLPRIPYSKRGRIVLSLENIFTDSKKLYLRCKLENLSSIKYNINFMNLFQTTEKANKAVSDQDLPIPIFILPDIKNIDPHGYERFILSCDKFTLENNRIAILEIYEKAGGRHLKIRLTNDLILRAVLLNEKNTGTKNF